MNHLLFVYGTLREYKRPIARIYGDLYKVCNHTGAYKYPAARRVNISSGLIEGEVLIVNDIELKRLDMYEGVPILYKRIETTVLDEYNEPLCVAWVYEFSHQLPEKDRISYSWENKKR